MPVPVRPIAVHVLTRLLTCGASRSVLSGLERMSRLGVRTVLITGIADASEQQVRELLADYPDLPVLRLKRLVGEPAPWKDLRTLAAVTAAVRRLRPTVVHTHAPKAGGIGRLATCLAGGYGVARRGQPPLRIHTFHGEAGGGPASGTWSPLRRTVEAQLARRASDRVLAVSPAHREQLIENLGEWARPKVDVLPLAREPRPEDGARRPAPSSETASDRWVSVRGGDSPFAGLQLLATAHARLLSLEPARGARLRVAVAGPVDPTARRRLARLLSQAGLTHAWRIDSQPLGAETRPRADAVVVPAPCGRTAPDVIDAFAAGLPVIATISDVIEELIACRWEQLRPGGWITHRCEPRGLSVQGDPDSWADALGRLVDDRDAVPGSPQERRRFVAEVFDAAARAQELMTLYGIGGQIADRAAIGGADRRGPPRAARIGVGDTARPADQAGERPRPAL